MSEKRAETVLQRETRLTGHKEFCTFVQEEVAKVYKMPTVSLALVRKVIGRWCGSKAPKDFHKKVSDYITGPEYQSLGLFTAIEQRVRTIDAIHFGEPVEGGIGMGVMGSGMGGGLSSAGVLAGRGPASSSSIGGLRKFKQDAQDPADQKTGNFVYVRPGSTLELDMMEQQQVMRNRMNTANASNQQLANAATGHNSAALQSKFGSSSTVETFGIEGLCTTQGGLQVQDGLQGGLMQSGFQGGLLQGGLLQGGLINPAGAPVTGGPQRGLQVGLSTSNSTSGPMGDPTAVSLVGGLQAAPNPLMSAHHVTMPSPDDDTEEEDDAPMLTLPKAQVARDVDRYANSSTRTNMTSDPLSNISYKFLEEDGEERQKGRKVGGGIRVFRGNAGGLMMADDETEPAQQVYGLQHDVLNADNEALDEKIMHEVAMDEYDEMALDRQWYEADEAGSSHVSDTYGHSMDDNEIFVKEMKLKKNQEALVQKKQSLQLKERLAAAEAWENRLLGQAGLAGQQEIDLDSFKQTNEVAKQHVVVSENIPPFLDGRVVYTTQAEPVSVVRDPTADLATLAKKGCDSLKKMREEQTKEKVKNRFWEMQGSKMGAVVQGENGEMKEKSEDKDEAGDYDYKKENQFAEAMKGKTEAQSDFSKNRTIDEVRRSLPVYSVRQEFLDLLREHQIIVAVGETGSGKTTQLTQYLYEAGYTSAELKIGCTQPRRMAAMSVAKRVSEEKHGELGDLVGYSIRFEDCTSENTRIKYMTDGVLLRETLMDADLEKYSCIIMDEAHERTLNTDVLFGIVKQVAARRKDFRLVVTSATMDSEKFQNFFGGVPIFQIPGRTFPVETYFAKAASQDYVDSAVVQVLQIHVGQPRGDILVFMTGQEDIDATCVMLANRLSEVGEKVPNLEILPVYSTMPADLQARIFQPSKYRKVIVATNIAETSLTVDGVKYVVDSGFCKLKVYDPKMGMDSLLVTPIAQANANQRRGRAGRTEPGMCWRLYTERAFVAEMHESPIPEIQRTNLSQVVLLLKSLGIDNLLQFDFMDAPPQETIINSMFQLWMLGALDNLGNLTSTGRKMGDFPVDPPLAKMILTSVDLRCVQEMLILISMLNVPNIFYRPKEKAEESDAQREKFSIPESDHLTFLNVFLQWRRNGYSTSWCGAHYIQPKCMKKVRETLGQLTDIVNQQSLPHTSCGSDWDPVRKSICSGYFHNASKMRGIGEYINLRSSIPCHLHPTSALYGLGYTPDYVVYHEVVLTTKEYMQHVTAVEPAWLAEMGPMFFSVRETGSDLQALRRQDAENQRKMEYEQKLHEDKKRLELEKIKENDVKDARNRESTMLFGKKKNHVQKPVREIVADLLGVKQEDESDKKLAEEKKIIQKTPSWLQNTGNTLGGDPQITEKKVQKGKNLIAAGESESEEDEEAVAKRRAAKAQPRKKRKMNVG